VCVVCHRPRDERYSVFCVPQTTGWIQVKKEIQLPESKLSLEQVKEKLGPKFGNGLAHHLWLEKNKNILLLNENKRKMIGFKLENAFLELKDAWESEALLAKVIPKQTEERDQKLLGHAHYLIIEKIEKISIQILDFQWAIQKMKEEDEHINGWLKV